MQGNESADERGRAAEWWGRPGGGRRGGERIDGRAGDRRVRQPERPRPGDRGAPEHGAALGQDGADPFLAVRRWPGRPRSGGSPSTWLPELPGGPGGPAELKTETAPLRHGRADISTDVSELRDELARLRETIARLTEEVTRLRGDRSGRRRRRRRSGSGDQAGARMTAGGGSEHEREREREGERRAAPDPGGIRALFAGHRRHAADPGGGGSPRARWRAVRAALGRGVLGALHRAGSTPAVLARSGARAAPPICRRSCATAPPRRSRRTGRVLAQRRLPDGHGGAGSSRCSLGPGGDAAAHAGAGAGDDVLHPCARCHGGPLTSTSACGGGRSATGASPRSRRWRR